MNSQSYFSKLESFKKNSTRLESILIQLLSETTMTSQLHKPIYAPSFSLFPKSSINPNHLIKHGNPSLISIVPRHHVHQNRNKKNSSSVIRAASGELKSSPTSVSTVNSAENQAFTVKALVTVMSTVEGFLSGISLTRPLDDITDLLGSA
ncbi:hypothetical protein ACFX2I_039570 [Malus domestica]